MIAKAKLMGKHVTYIYKHKHDPYGSWRTGKVVKITGNTLTVKNAVGVRKRINPKTTKILGRQFRKNGLEEIKW